MSLIKKRITQTVFLLLVITIQLLGQDKRDVLLSVVQNKLNPYVFELTLKNNLDTTLFIAPFYSQSNGLLIKSPEGKEKFSGFIVCPDPRIISIPPGGEKKWNFDTKVYLFNPLFVRVEDLYGKYEFQWYVNDFVSERFFFEYK